MYQALVFYIKCWVQVVTEVLRSNVFELAVRYIDAYGSVEAAPEDLITGLEGLAGMVSSEEFTTQKVRARWRALLNVIGGGRGRGEGGRSYLHNPIYIQVQVTIIATTFPLG